METRRQRQRVSVGTERGSTPQRVATAGKQEQFDIIFISIISLSVKTLLVFGRLEGNGSMEDAFDTLGTERGSTPQRAATVVKLEM